VHGVDGAWEFDEFRLLALLKHRAHHTDHVRIVESKRDLPAVRLILHCFKRLAADKIMVELDHDAITQVPGRQIIVFDIPGDEATTQ
jgi:hypothetical protein